MKVLGKFFAVISLFIMIGSQAQAAIIEFDFSLNGDQEVGPVATSASGHAVMTYDTITEILNYQITITGLDLDGFQTASVDDDIVGMHFHHAVAGSNGGVVFFISNDDDLLIDPILGTVSGSWGPSDGIAGSITDLLAGELYINVHTQAVPSGEIRGQATRVQSVPEPSVLLLLMLGIVGIFLSRRL